MTAIIDRSSKWSRIAITLVSTTLLYNVLEAVVALWSGRAAHSIALVGFGLDSAIETAAAIVMLYRLWVEYRGAEASRIGQIEHRVHRFIGATFVLLALYVTGQATWTLWQQDAPDESLVGIALAALSLACLWLRGGSCGPRGSSEAPRCVPRPKRPWLARTFHSLCCSGSLPTRWPDGGGPIRLQRC